MTQPEWDKEWRKASRDLTIACQHMDGDYLDYDLRQYWYAQHKKARDRMDYLLDIDPSATPA